jgi:hypothetical protein
MDNRNQVERICTEYMNNETLLLRAQDRIAELRSWENYRDQMLRRQKELRTQIRGLKFHDIGHARGDLAKDDARIREEYIQHGSNS